MLNPFSYLRNLAAQSVVQGVADGLRAVTPEGESPPDIAELRALLASATEMKALPGHDEEPTKKGRGK